MTEAFMILISAIILFAVVGLVAIILCIRFVMRYRENRELTGGKDELGMMQEIYAGLQRMESRVEALETILLEREADDSPQS